MIILWIGIALTLGLFLTGSPIFAALGIGAGFLSLVVFGLPPTTVADMLIENIAHATLLALPLFIYMGCLFLYGGSAKSLIKSVESIFGRIPGGIGIATVVAAAFFAAISGSSTATWATIGIIMIPEMVSLNYEKGFAGAIVASSGALGNMIPPSIVFILYGVLCEKNIATLFAAGMLPGIITAGILATTTFVIALRKHYPLPPPVPLKEKGQLFVKAVPALIMPVIVLGSIYGGIATPTEAASVACIYAMFLGFFVYRGLNLKTLWKATFEATVTISAIMLMVAGGAVLGKMFVIAGFPEAIKELVMRAELSPVGFLCLAGLVIIILGTFIEAILLVYIAVPLFYPSVLVLGISPIHFGVLVVFGYMVGANTPPMAGGIYITSRAGNVPSEDIIRFILPFVIALVVAYYIAICFPEISLIVPRLMGMVV